MNERESTIEGIRSALEALSDEDYLAALPARCLGCGSATLPCHCNPSHEAVSLTARQILLQRLESARDDGTDITELAAELARLNATISRGP